VVNVVEKVQVVENLPKGWKWARLGDVCNTTSGGTPSRGNASYYGGGIPWVKSGELTDGDVFKTSEKITQEGLNNSSAKLFPSGTLLIALYGATVGKLGILQMEAATNQAVCAIFPNELVLKDFLFFHLLSCREDLLEISFGGAQPNISQNIIRDLIIPLPPLPEQKRIVGILSDRLTAIDKARIATEAQLKAAKALPAAYLRQVFDSPEAQKWKRKKFGDIALTVQNGVYKSSEYYGHGYPFIRMYNIQNTSWNLNLDTLAQVSLDDHELEKFRLEVGDLLISRVNSFELVGKCGLVSSMAKGYVFENMLIRVQLIDSIDSLFVAQQMGHCTIRKQVQGVAKQAIGQASINSTDIRNIELMLPSFSEQRTISAKINKALEQVEKLQQSLQSQLTTINQLPAVILRQAFNGEL